jgi:U3 small nucleolar RNA-associated protein 18
LTVPHSCLQSKQLCGTVKMNENASCMVFSDDGLRLYSSGDRGNVYSWDLRMPRRLLARFHDQGSQNTRSLALAGGQGLLAVGSANGVVNLYDANKLLRAPQERNPQPLKVIMNLTTPVDQLQFNHDGQLLAMLSRRKLDQLRVLNVNTLSVVPNWPTSATPLHYASCAAFSPQSDKLVVGNDRGRALLYSLHHYSPR